MIGIALDGTGYGTDGHIWGGEVLIADYLDVERAAHLRYIPMPGGAAAIREPWRMAVSYMAQAFGPDFLDLHVPFIGGLHRGSVELILRAMKRGVNSPLTSSCGRLFDAVAALVGVRNQVNYEAQAAIELEMLARDSADAEAYGFSITGTDGELLIDPAPLFTALVNDLEHKVAPCDISRRFHAGLADVFVEVAMRLRDRSGLQRVCLSGGTFQNVLLFTLLHARLESRGFQVFSHQEVPAGDGGLSLGQAVVAAHRLTLSKTYGIQMDV